MTHLEEQALEFLTQNMHRNYPIQDTCIVESDDGTYLPSSFLVDLRLNIPSEDTVNIDTSRFFISAVNHYTSSVQVVISYQPAVGNAFECACSSAIVTTGGGAYPEEVPVTPAAGIPEGATYEPFRNMTGTLYIGTTADMVNLPSLKFSYENAAINPTCVVRTIFVQGFTTSITLLDEDGELVATLGGDAKIQAGPGILFSLATGTATPTVLVSVDMDWLASQVQEAVEDAGTPIKQINNVLPDSEGNIIIRGLDCTSVDTIGNANSITISNTCSKPCCGEDSADLVDIKNSQQTLSTQVDRLTQSINSFIISLNNVETRLPSLVASRK